MIKLEIHDTQIDEFTGISKKSGNPFNIRKQTGFAHLSSSPYPIQISINLDDGQAPFLPATYELLEDSYFVNNFGQLQIGRLKLKKIADLKLAKTAN